MENEDIKYFQFPLFLLRDLMTDKVKTLNNIIYFGLYKASQRVKVDIREVARQLMYMYHRERKKIPYDLLSIIEDSIENGTLEIDEDYNGFNGKEFDPELSVDCLLHKETGLFCCHGDFFDMAVELYQIRQAYSFIEVNGDFATTLLIGKKIEARIPDKEPLPMVSKNKVFEFRDNNKTERDMITFACNIGIKSIIGTKPYCKTNKEMILCRAHGYKNRASMPDKLPATFIKYNKRYHIDRILVDISEKWKGINIYARHIRGMYIGKLSVDELAQIAEKRKQKNVQSAYRDKQKQAYLKTQKLSANENF